MRVEMVYMESLLSNTENRINDIIKRLEKQGNKIINIQINDELVMIMYEKVEPIEIEYKDIEKYLTEHGMIAISTSDYNALLNEKEILIEELNKMKTSKLEDEQKTNSHTTTDTTKNHTVWDKEDESERV